VDAPLDEIARRAGVGNATLYRHFPTRRELVVEVYADEVAALCADGTARLDDPDPVAALFGWLAAFVAHVATRRHLALSIPDGPASDRGLLFDRWHGAMHETAVALVDRAGKAGTLRADVTATDLLTLAHGIGLTTADPVTARRLLGLVRHGTS
jgi:AcrR family transcriptional regulator